MLCKAGDTSAWFLLVRSVRVSVIASHNQIFVGHQDCYSAGETAIRNFRFGDWPEKRYVWGYDPIRPLQIKQHELYLNLERYPYDDINLDFNKNRWSIFYNTYARFVKIMTDTIISNRIKLSRLFSIIIRSWLSIILVKMNQERNCGCAHRIRV